MGSTRRKIGNATKPAAVKDISGIDKMVQKLIEDRNYLIFSLCNKDVLQIERMWMWSVEGLYQFILANHVEVKKAESAQKTAKEKSKLKVRK